MATVRTLSGLPSAGRRSARDARNDQGRDASPHGAVLVLGDGNTLSQEEALKRIASLPPIQRGRVLDIRRQITDGTYEMEHRLDQAMDRLLEVLTGPPGEACLDGHGGSRAVRQAIGWPVPMLQQSIRGFPPARRPLPARRGEGVVTRRTSLRGR